MRYYLVDYENVKEEGLEGMENLTSKDCLVIFYSKNANKITINQLQKIQKAKCKVEYIEIQKLGRNALDFNLVYFIGIKSGKFRGTHLEMNIISKDTGFDTLKENPMLSNLPANTEIKRYETIENTEKKTKNKIEEQAKIIEEILSKKALDKYKDIAINLFKVSTSKKELHNQLVSKLGGPVGREVYAELKSNFSVIEKV
ncbi:PIN domain-containing protein [Thomasclavelia cocleata]|uniref:PIN domain-containing protein n=1 Tax=Thomasclavelia cocleata TaxID=69824 RepID=UPI00256F5793|nr:PIN domain-containing protein [Thomasclavelia cocleata]